MADLTRRGFLISRSVTTGVGIVGSLGLHQVLSSQTTPRVPDGGLTTAGTAAPTGLPGLSLARPDGRPRARHLATAEISVMVGTQELVYRDPELVARLVKSAGGAPPPGG